MRFVERMQAAGTDVILLGPYGKGDPGSAGIDSLDAWKEVPENFPGLVWTNRIENAREWAEASGAAQHNHVGKLAPATWSIRGPFIHLTQFAKSRS